MILRDHLAGRTAMLAESHVEMKSGRTRPGRRRHRHREDAAVSRAGRPVALGHRAGSRAPGRVDALRSAHVVFSAGHAAGGARLSLGGARVRARGVRACARAAGSRAPDVPMLEQSRRWESVLNEGEQQSLAFARALLHAPVGWSSTRRSRRWMRSLPRVQVNGLWAKELAQTGVLYIGRGVAHDSLSSVA